MRMKRSPSRSMARPRSGLKTMPITPPAARSVATHLGLLVEDRTSTQGAKVMKSCLRVP